MISFVRANSQIYKCKNICIIYVLSVRHLSAIIESRTSERIFIKFHTGALEWLPMCVEIFTFWLRSATAQDTSHDFQGVFG